MSNETDLKKSNVYVVWLEKSIKEGYIIYFEYSDFKNIQLIGRGSFGKVFRANWKDTNTTLALKSFDDDCDSTLKEVVNEV